MTVIIILSSDATEEHIKTVTDILEDAGYGGHVSRGEERTIIGAVGTEPEMRDRLMQKFRGFSFVERVVPVLKPYKLVSIRPHEERSQVEIGGVPIGPGRFTVIAGPCAVENEEQTLAVARAVREAGVNILRGGAYKPRTSPYDFQGLGEDGLKILAAAREETGLAVVTEARTTEHVEKVTQYADAIQIGARNMQNFDLLKEAGRANVPVLLKRGFASTVEEWLKAAEYVASVGNLNIVLCERGIRTFESEVRFTQDLSVIPVVQQMSHLPVIVDPSHASGMRSIVTPVSRAAAAVGADGLLVEVHPDPETALCDGPQQLGIEAFGDLMRQLRKLGEALGKQV